MEGQAAEIGGTEAAKGAAAVAGSTPAPQSTSVFGNKEAPAEEKKAADPEAKADAKADAKAEPEDYEADWLKDFLKGKFKTRAAAEESFGANSREAKKAIKDAEALQASLDAWKPHHGAPKDAEGKPAKYELEIPEGADLDPAVADVMNEIGHELDLAPAVLNKALAKVLPWFLGDEVGRRERTEKELSTLFGGTPEGFKAGITSLEAFASRMGIAADDQAVEDFIECGNHPAAVRTLERLRVAMTGGNMARSTGTHGFGEAEYQALLAKQVKSPLTQEEQARVTGYLRQLFPDPQA